MPRSVKIALLLSVVVSNGCGSTVTPGDADDARRFAMAECNRLANTERKVLPTEDGKWRATQTAVRNPIPAWPKNHEVKIVYELKTLQSSNFATKEEAQEAELLHTEEGWTERTLWYAFQNGKWTPKDH